MSAEEAAIRIGTIVQARMSSRRLPGKVLQDVAGKPLLEHLLEGLRHCAEVELVVLATSREREDDPVARFATERDVPCHRGPLDDVARRFRDASREHELDAFVRVNGDSPLLDHRLVDRAAAIYRSGDFDFVTNVMPRTFPTGQSVEVAGTQFYDRIYGELADPEDLENVTPFIYRHRDRYRIGTFESEKPYNGVRMAVDTDEDLRNVEAVFARLEAPRWEYDVDELVAIYREEVA